jgi:hypothetical protein
MGTAASPADNEPMSTATGGQPLAPAVRMALEESYQVDMRGVRVHSDSGAQEAAAGLSTRAFAFGNNIVLGPGESATDLGLMAHEGAHVVQQQAAPIIQRYTPGGDAYEREAHQASAAVVRGETFQVQQRTQPRVQGLGLSDIRDYIADKANIIPGFRMFTIVIGVNPINGAEVDRSPGNILRAIIEFIPFGGLVTQALNNYNIFDKIGNWVAQQIKSLGMVGSSFVQAISDFISSLGVADFARPSATWERAKKIFTGPIDQLISFAEGLLDGIVQFIKDAILKPLAALAEGTPGWALLTAVLGKNPITGEKVTPTAENLIGPFMTLIGQEEIWENMKKANAVARAFAWFKGALSGLMSFVEQIPDLFISTLKSLEIVDLIVPPLAFIKVGKAFGGFLANFTKWALDQVIDLLKIIFAVVAPGAMPYLQKVGAAFNKILKDPISFVGNLVKAGKLGFQNFASNIGTHLKRAFLEWLTGSLPGIYIPKALNLKEFALLALSVLGITWANIRQKLVKATSENIVKGLETGFAIVKKLVTEGPAAAWEEIKSQLSNLKDMVMEGIMNFIVETVVKKAIAKVVGLLVPGGAFIQAIISIYDTVMVFIAKLKKIIQVAMAFLDSMMAIANGVIGAAASKVESTLAGLLVLAISFLAGFLGLNKIADKVMDIINTKVRAPVDKAIDFVINWIVTTAKSLFKALFGKKDADKGDTAESKAVKAKVAAELSGKQIKSKAEEESLIAATYAKYQPQGLKGIKFQPRGKNIEVIVSASLAERIAAMTVADIPQLLQIASTMSPYAGVTTIYITYDGGKSYGKVSQKRQKPGHAEMWLMREHAGPLLARIAREYRQGKTRTPQGQPVPVVFDINRLPCKGCTDNRIIAFIDQAKAQYPDVPITLTINAAALTAQSSPQMTLDSIVAMKNRGIEVKASDVWSEIQKKMKEFAAFDFKQEFYADWQFDDFKSKAAEVQQAIDDAVKKINAMPTQTKSAGSI